MSLLNLSLPALLIGLVALAAILFLLQRLRVRYREHTVITTLFWKEALEEARARVLVRRFRHPLAYLFVLLIAWLMWLGFADPKLSSAAERDHVILLDGSAGMGRGQRFADTVELVKERVRTLPRDRAWVIFCGGRPRTLLQPGENALLFEARLEGVGPEACPATVDTVLRVLTKSLSRDRDTDILVAGDAPLSTTACELLPERAHLRRLLPAAPVLADNQGITALGVARSSTGVWERVDVLCEVQGTVSRKPALVVSLGGRPIELEARYSQDEDPTRTRILLVDVPASGGLLTVRLQHPPQQQDALAADDTATIRLPKRQRIRVALDSELAATVGPVLTADPAVIVTADRPEVVVRQGSEGPSSLPTLDFVPIETQEEAILLHHTEGRSQAVLVASFQQLGLSEVDAMDIAQASGHKIAVGARPTTLRRRISLWEPLLSERFNFV
ncbi:MAG: vWA domain-containing protein, partial [Planctomycetota bacterium]